MSLKFNWGGYYEAVKDTMTEEDLKKPLTEFDEVFQLLIDLEKVEHFYEINKDDIFQNEINKLNSPLLDSILYYKINSKFDSDNLDLLDFILSKDDYNIFSGKKDDETIRTFMEKLNRKFREIDDLAKDVVKSDCVNMLKRLISNYELDHNLGMSVEDNGLTFIEIAMIYNAEKCFRYLITLEYEEIYGLIEMCIHQHNVEYLEIALKYILENKLYSKQNYDDIIFFNFYNDETREAALMVEKYKKLAFPE